MDSPFPQSLIYSYTTPKVYSSSTPGSSSHSSIQSNLRILLFSRSKIFARQKHGPINRNGQAPMPSPNHDRTKDQLTEFMPAAAKGIRNVRQTDGDAYAAVAGNDFEEDVEDGVVDWVAFELGGFCYGDEEDGQDDPPEVVGKLAAQLLADKVAAGFGSRS